MHAMTSRWPAVLRAAQLVVETTAWYCGVVGTAAIGCVAGLTPRAVDVILIVIPGELMERGIGRTWWTTHVTGCAATLSWAGVLALYAIPVGVALCISGFLEVSRKRVRGDDWFSSHTAAIVIVRLATVVALVSGSAAILWLAGIWIMLGPWCG
jgi:hypothetical protein